MSVGDDFDDGRSIFDAESRSVTRRFVAEEVYLDLVEHYKQTRDELMNLQNKILRLTQSAEALAKAWNESNSNIPYDKGRHDSAVELRELFEKESNQ